MKILYIHQYFKTPEEGGCTRSFHLAKGLVAAGHEVVLITAHDWKDQTETIEGIKVDYLKIPYKNGFGFIKRIIAFYEFVKRAIRKSNTIKSIDIAYVMTTPLSTGLIALHLKKKRNIPYLFEVGDLWPEAPIQMGVIKNKWAKSMLYKFEKKCYLASTKVIALSPAIKDHINTLVPEVEVEIVTNIAHCDVFECNALPELKNGTFNIGYIGTLGRANNLEGFINLASESIIRKIPIHFHIMGEGAEQEKIQAASQANNVTYYGFGSTGKVVELMNKLDAIYVSFKNIPILNTGSPNKFFDGLAAGKLIVINFEGWVKKLIEEHQCGFYHSPLDSDTFFSQIKSYIENPKLLSIAQKNSRKLANSTFDKPILVEELSNIIDQLERPQR